MLSTYRAETADKGCGDLMTKQLQKNFYIYFPKKPSNGSVFKSDNVNFPQDFVLKTTTKTVCAIYIKTIKWTSL